MGVIRLHNSIDPPLLQAPEVFLGKPYDDKCDVFSFGIIAYEVIHRYQMISATDGSMDECQVSIMSNAALISIASTAEAPSALA